MQNCVLYYERKQKLTHTTDSNQILTNRQNPLRVTYIITYIS